VRRQPAHAVLFVLPLSSFVLRASIVIRASSFGFS